MRRPAKNVPPAPLFSESSTPPSRVKYSPVPPFFDVSPPPHPEIMRLESGMHRRFHSLGIQGGVGQYFDVWIIKRVPGKLHLTNLGSRLSSYDVLTLSRAAAAAVDRRQAAMIEAGLDPLKSNPIMRDISFLDPSDVSNKQDILCRKGCIIYGLKFARALVLEDVAYIFPDEGFDAEKHIIDGVLQAADPLLVEDSFEYVILSALFSVVVQSFTSQLTKLKDTFRLSTTGDNLDLDFERGSQRLREAEQFQVEIDAARQAVDLHDRGAQGLVISLDPFIKGPKEGEHVKNPRFTAEVQEIEELFEWCESTLESLKAACIIHIIKLKTEQEKVQQAMTQRRSRLLLIQILIQLITMAFAFCSMVSGFFGMNLSNGWCGPDGCKVLGTLDFGHFAFESIVVFSLAAGFLIAWMFFVFGYRAANSRK